jgi:hypothetical protein
MGGRGITESEAIYLLNNDIQLATDQLSGRDFYQVLDEVRRGVMIEMVINLGIWRFLEFKIMIHALLVNDWEGAVKAAKESIWATQIGENRLNDMKHRLILLMNVGVRLNVEQNLNVWEFVKA